MYALEGQRQLVGLKRRNRVRRIARRCSNRWFERIAQGVGQAAGLVNFCQGLGPTLAVGRAQQAGLSQGFKARHIGRQQGQLFLLACQGGLQLGLLSLGCSGLWPQALPVLLQGPNQQATQHSNSGEHQQCPARLVNNGAQVCHGLPGPVFPAMAARLAKRRHQL